MHDRVRDVLDSKGHGVYTTTPTTLVIAAIEIMNDRRIGALVVVDGGVTVGIFTERDVLVRLVAAGLDAQTTRVADVMTRSPLTVSSQESVADAMKLMTDRRCRHLPVSHSGELDGLISIGDLMNWLVIDKQRYIDDLHAFIRAA